LPESDVPRKVVADVDGERCRRRSAYWNVSRIERKKKGAKGGEQEGGKKQEEKGTETRGEEKRKHEKGVNEQSVASLDQYEQQE
jgi:hypothetical protein